MNLDCLKLALLLTCAALCAYSGYVSSVAKSNNSTDKNNLFLTSIIMCVFTGIGFLSILGLSVSTLI
jgi:hypothetical protein